MRSLVFMSEPDQALRLLEADTFSDVVFFAPVAFLRAALAGGVFVLLAVVRGVADRLAGLGDGFAVFPALCSATALLSLSTLRVS